MNFNNYQLAKINNSRITPYSNNRIQAAGKKIIKNQKK